MKSLWLCNLPTYVVKSVILSLISHWFSVTLILKWRGWTCSPRRHQRYGDLLGRYRYETPLASPACKRMAHSPILCRARPGNLTNWATLGPVPRGVPHWGGEWMLANGCQQLLLLGTSLLPLISVNTGGLQKCFLWAPQLLRPSLSQCISTQLHYKSHYNQWGRGRGRL